MPQLSQGDRGSDLHFFLMFSHAHFRRRIVAWRETEPAMLRQTFPDSGRAGERCTEFDASAAKIGLGRRAANERRGHNQPGEKNDVSH